MTHGNATKISTEIIKDDADGNISFHKSGQDVIFMGKANPVPSKAMDSNLMSDFIEFKKHVYNELSALQTKVPQAQGPPIANERPLGTNDLVQSLYDRIASLEKQLDCQNQIILKMIDTNQDRFKDMLNYEKLKSNSIGIVKVTKPESPTNITSPEANQALAKNSNKTISKKRKLPKDEKDDKQSEPHEEVATNSKEHFNGDENIKTKKVNNKTWFINQ